MKLILVATILSAATLSVDAKVYGYCELGRELKSYGITNSRDIATWVCIAYYESTMNTRAVNPNGQYFGLFQIGSPYWCSPPGTGCGIPCTSLVDDSITDDFQCAKKIYSSSGFGAWSTYSKCKSPDSFISGCGL